MNKKEKKKKKNERQIPAKPVPKLTEQIPGLLIIRQRKKKKKIN